MKKLFKNFSFLLLMSTVLGVLVGIILGDKAKFLAPFGTIFTRLLGMVIPGLVFFSIAQAFASIGNVRKLTAWAGKIIGWFLVTTTIGTLIGTVMGLIFKPGLGLTVPDANYEVTSINVDTFIDFLPVNVFETMSSGSTIQIVFLSIFVGVAVVVMKNEESKSRLTNFLNSGQELFLTLVKGIMYYAPIGIFSLMASSVSSLRGSLLKEMTSFLVAVSVGFVCHIVICYFIMPWVIAKVNPFKFIKKIFPALITAFSTTSSAGTMPLTMQCARDLGVDDEMVNFGVPLGVTFNMDSVAIQVPLEVMLGMFAAGLSPTLPQLMLCIVLGIALSIGCAGVPGGGLAICAILINALGLPVEVLTWVSAVFFFLDVTGTTINIWGDLVCTTIVAEKVGMFNREKFNQ